MMTWTSAELSAVGAATELELAAKRTDGYLSSFVTMWVVRVGDDLYVRSTGGLDRPWYRRATASGEGRVRAGGSERNVTLADADPGAQAGIDAAYHASTTAMARRPSAT